MREKTISKIVVFALIFTLLYPLTSMQAVGETDIGDNQIADISPIENLYKKNEGIQIYYDKTPNDNDDEENLKDVVVFGDKNLEQAIKDQLGITDRKITVNDMKFLSTLSANNKEISDLSGIEHATNLNSLFLVNNHISDLSPLSNLVNLFEINLAHNKISDLRPLERMTNLSTLYLMNNLITDITPISAIPKLTYLELAENQISDITPIGKMTNLYHLGLAHNQISDLSPLENVKNLTQLIIPNNKIEDITPLTQLTNLRYLALGNNKVNNLAPLSNLNELDSLLLENNSINTISDLAGLTRLTQLNISNNRIKDITAIGQLENLVWLDASNNLIDNIDPLLVNVEKGIDLSVRGKGDTLQFNILYNNLNLLDKTTASIIEHLQSLGVRVIYHSQNEEIPILIDSLEMSVREASVGDNVTIKVEFTDMISNPRYAELLLKSPTSNISWHRQHVPLAYDEEQGLWIGSFTVDENHEHGIWEVEYIYFEDIDGFQDAISGEHLPHSIDKSLFINNEQKDLITWAALSYFNALGNRTNFKINIGVMDINLLSQKKDQLEVTIELEGENSQKLILDGDISNQWDHFYVVEFDLPDDIDEGYWLFKEVVFSNGKNKFTFNKFLENKDFSHQFYMPSLEADEWVRSTLSTLIFKDHYITLPGEGYLLINDFIEKYRYGLPPYVDVVTHEKLLEFANKTGDPYGDEIFLYSLYKDGFIDSEEEPLIPIQVYNFRSEVVYEAGKEVEWYVTEILHNLHVMHDVNNTVTAYILSPAGQEYVIDNFIYDPKFNKFDLININEGGWIGSFKLPEQAYNGIWQIDRIEISSNKGTQTFVNGKDFYNASFELSNANPLPDTKEPIDECFKIGQGNGKGLGLANGNDPRNGKGIEHGKGLGISKGLGNGKCPGQNKGQDKVTTFSFK
ncbi:leucine-rich repeat domain-containing protein [Anaerobacillus sp. MEB173]|uniref:leucine-rich repeat domain-containing protein n=1 Tax=Anaerobacillus sp. MEB173 TaxID=3383345 RepID=UPI003F93B763